MKAVAYVRVSTEDQARHGVSLDAQEAKIRSWADSQGLEVKALYADEGISGMKASKRPGLQSALASCKKGDTFVVYSLSRFGRSTRETLNLEDDLSRRGVALYSVSEPHMETRSAPGRLQFRISAVFAELERDLISERTKTALQYKKTQGQRVGSIPYGFRLAEDGIHLLPDPAEQKVVEAVRAFHAAGLSLRAIASELESAGFTNRSGSGFNPKTISSILKAA
jgi:site-specific DNA recombinase